MTKSKTRPPSASRIEIESLHIAHPKIRAQDWRSPLVARLTGEKKPYADGAAPVATSFKSQDGSNVDTQVELKWAGLKDDYEQCLNTYQSPVITEFAALAVACILCEHRAGLEITQVTRRGERVDYWLGDRELLIEVSGTKDGDLDELCASKAKEQLQENPFEKDGYVCASRFDDPEARLWFYAYPKVKKKRR